MTINEIIEKKRDKREITREEIKYFVENYTNGNIPDYQASALIMAIFLNGMTKQEITDLTLEMAYSGEILDLSEVSDIVIDKHSTGGVGDKITLVLIPIIASLGIPVAKMSGRGLGFSGGTIDKLESIPGFRAELSIDEFIDNVKKTGISITGQSKELAPADKKIYALRDTISCVESMPLIASSIMSKKIAAGANKIILDVTVGSGAFMKTREKATELANMMKNIGILANRETICVLTNMEEPVGKAVGNTLEILETIKCLKGEIPEDIKTIVETIGAYIIKLSGKSDDIEQNKKVILENIYNGKAYNKFLELIENQSGDITYIQNPEKFPKVQFVIPVVSEKAGYVSKLDAEIIGKTSVMLGAGRLKKTDNIDNAVGIILNKKIGDSVEIGEILGYIYANDEEKGNKAVYEMQQAYEISNEPIREKMSYIIDII